METLPLIIYDYKKEKKKAKEEKKIEKQKVKMYIFSAKYIFLKFKERTNEHKQKKTNEP